MRFQEIMQIAKIVETKKLVFAVFLFLLGSLSPVAVSKAQTAKTDKPNLVPVVLIHGIGGSDLRQPKGRGLIGDGGFPNDVLKFLAGDPQKLQFDSRGEPRADTISKSVEAAGFYDVPGSRNITDLSKFLQAKGFVLNQTLFEFSYDFRFSAIQNAAELGKFIEQIKQKSPTGQVDIVGHSMGGIVAKAYLAGEENAANVRNLIFVGTPHLGAPKALKALRYGDNLEVSIIDGCKLKRFAHNLPGMFNLLPGKRYFTARGGYFIDDDDLDKDGVRGLLDYEQTVFNLKNGVETKCRLNPKVDVAPIDKGNPVDRLSAALIDRHSIEFHDALDDWKKPETVKVFNLVGYGASTIETIKESGGRVTYEYTTEGDGTVPMWSAEAVESDYLYHVNVRKLKTEHAAMIGDVRLDLQIYQLLVKGAGVYTPEVVLRLPVKQIDAPKK